MSIVKLDRVTLFGASFEKDGVIDALQELGCVHVENLGSPEDDTPAEENIAGEARSTLKYLESCGEQRRQAQTEDFDEEQVLREVIAVQRKERDLQDEHDALRKAIRDTTPWGELLLPEDGRIAGLRFWFFVVPLHEYDDFPQSSVIWREASRDRQFAYIVVVAKDEPEDLPGTQVQLDPRPLSKLTARLEEVEDEQDEMHYRRVGLTRWRDLLTRNLHLVNDAAARTHVAGQTLDERGVFALQGWAPVTHRKQLESFAGERGLAITLEPPGPDDEPPTLLQNPEEIAGGEGCVTFYKTPAYVAWDPSGVVLFSFALFFAMILADAGYAALLGILLWWNWSKLGSSQGGRRARSLLLILVSSAFVYGVLAGSYFGISPAENSALAAIQILDVQNQALMMPLSIAIGVLHLVVANAVVAWRNRGNVQSFASWGWVAVLVGGYTAGLGLMAPLKSALAAWLSNSGVVLLVGGLLSVLLFSSQQPLLPLGFKSLTLRLVDGVKGLTGFTSLFGDVLSYLRLFALGLSSAQLAGTFNNLGKAAWDTAGFGVLLSMLIILMGHTLNLLLAIMSGVVHGLRLNCIEFFRWSLPGEGYLFRPFAKEAKIR